MFLRIGKPVGKHSFRADIQRLPFRNLFRFCWFGHRLEARASSWTRSGLCPVSRQAQAVATSVHVHEL